MGPADRLDPLALAPRALEAWVLAAGFSAGKARNLFRILHESPGVGIAALRGADRELSARLARSSDEHVLSPAGQQLEPEDGGTAKLLLTTDDGLPVEAVLMPRKRRDGYTLCVSSQVGCRLGCAFCRTGQMGLYRNLRAGEIVDQVRWARALAPGPVRNLVFMGMGEPFENLEAVLAAIEVVRAPEAYAIAARRITVSTAGHLAGLLEFTARAPDVHLAVSVNAPTDALRDRIMPINRRYPLGQLMAAIRAHAARRRGRVVAEYVLLAGVNDSPADAEALAGLVRGAPVKVNLIRFNPVEGSGFARPDEAAVEAFRRRLEELGIDVLERYSWGSGIAAACGQLGAEVLGIPAAGPGRPAPAPAPWSPVSV